MGVGIGKALKTRAVADPSAIVGGGVEDAYRNSRGNKHKHKHDEIEWASE